MPLCAGGKASMLASGDAKKAQAAMIGRDAPNATAPQTSIGSTKYTPSAGGGGDGAEASDNPSGQTSTDWLRSSLGGQQGLVSSLTSSVINSSVTAMMDSLTQTAPATPPADQQQQTDPAVTPFGGKPQINDMICKYTWQKSTPHNISTKHTDTHST